MCQAFSPEQRAGPLWGWVWGSSLGLPYWVVASMCWFFPAPPPQCHVPSFTYWVSGGQRHGRGRNTGPVLQAEQFVGDKTPHRQSVCVCVCDLSCAQCVHTWVASRIPM